MRTETANPLMHRLAAMAMLLACASARLHAGFADGAGADTDPIYIADVDKKVEIHEHLGALLPLDSWFTDETGKAVQLGEYFAGKRKPVIIQIGYYRCPMLCSEVSKGLVDSLKKVRLDAGPDYEVVFLSVDPRETPALAAQKKESFLKAYARDGSTNGWHLLTGVKMQIDRVTEAAGVEYRWVGQAQQYSHPAVLVLAMPDGKISRYLRGVRTDPQTLRLSLVEASNGKIGTVSDAFLLTCFQFDGQQGKYAWAAMFLMKCGGVVTMLVLGGFLFFHHRSQRNHHPPSES